jgi:hypothetical protein
LAARRGNSGNRERQTSEFSAELQNLEQIEFLILLAKFIEGHQGTE